MSTSLWIGRLVLGLGTVAQFILLFIALYMLLQMLPKRKQRWLHLSSLNWRTTTVSDRLLTRLRLSRSHPSFMEREALISGCGVEGDPALYIVLRRIALSVICPAAAVIIMYWRTRAGSWPSVFVVGGIIIASIMLYFDLPWLRSIHRMRSHRITKDVFQISNQLLYFAGSNLHLHTKLSRCVPFATVVQNDLQRLLAEWYHDAEEALRRFKQRLGTDDGASFVETLDSLRLHDNEEFYKLLRQRIQDYKEKLELAKESRKETTSYVLFTVAGLPIMYMFEVFLYPWVREGQQLFQSLNG
ncbi:hypothetical protein DFQ01_12658 [Paenibacillus cellulosilyticus]|uniref:Flp pilus assembly protein TadB n=1 Tax=Paenibacillus cellulosilyticus TaxID=375489 RepID=A0A2V2YWJ6_9BACL|nr:hypothetical protein [Paenibacillus cellulosilyticus]PWV95587.1 hypothetical protein DFQ01_12658 [Paenibacillus cellulosilyticus]QKS47342.1 hypothetical protein HUB94_23355 [Paenibacillus cellulosilyticus]